MKIGVVGLGSIGSRHYANVVKLGHTVLAYDPISRSNDVQFERQLYDEADAVVVATPTKFHEQALRACVERRKHILIEKPISNAIGPLESLLKIADTDNVLVMMGNNLRFHPCVQQVKRWLAAGDAGHVLWANFICATKADKYTDDGVVLNTGAHEVDLALYFFGPAICEIAVADAVEASFVLKHSTGMRSTFFLSLATPNRVREFWIAGAEKNIGVDLDARRMSLGETVMQAPGSYDDDYVNELRGFIDRINGRFAPGATGHDGLATLRTLLDVKRKAGIS